MLHRPILYPRIYPWYLLLASLDVMLTWVVLSMGGVELNTVAAWVIDRHDVTGMVMLKFATVLFVLCACERIGYEKDNVGRRLATFAVLINCVPVVMAVSQLGVYYGPFARAW
ncbi:MAG: hypothetical protein H6812_03940 [Phycisphaeraceae bacterium]|nr:hypothetical protein [Phycisphaerales bacterium]MCA9306568.1 hypothetical protein [Phycisphaerales bacterium]MCB9842388.1 hypothetical protein [Phycisphaeraceae bacterium]